MKPISRLLLLAAVALLLSTCSKSELEDNVPQPRIEVLRTMTIPAEGIVDASIEINVINGNGNEVRVNCDGKVITEAAYNEPYVMFSASETDSYDVRTGRIEIGCGAAVLLLDLNQRGGTNLPAVSGKRGWYELPALHRGGGYICYAHDKLPSDPSKRNYSFCFAPEHYASLWVAYPLHECYLGSADRTNKFGYDYAFAAFTGDNAAEPAMQAKVNAAYYSDGYKEGTQYSRGHQMPSADRTASTEDNYTTFYSTNMTPQIQGLNGGAWEKLESLTRETWICSDTLYVVTGAHFDEGYTYAYDDQGRGKACSVPTHYYKALLRTKYGVSGKSVAECSADELKCIAFVLEHDPSRSSKVVYTSDACSVADLERMTGVTFFINVPDAPKSVFNTSEWPGLTAR